MFKMNYCCIFPAIFFFTLPVSANECDIKSNTDIVRSAHIQIRTEEKITVNKVLGTQVFQGEKISVCDNPKTGDFILMANEPRSNAPARYFKDINGVPAYYLNDEYAYSIKSDKNVSFTAQGEKLSVTGQPGQLPGSVITIYATTDNPRPLSLSSAQIGSIKNSHNETVMRLMLSANIDPADNCVINNENVYFKFRAIDTSELPANTGLTSFSADNTLSLSCTDNRINKTVTMKLNSTSDYADPGQSIIASDNPGIGFMLFSNGKQITHQTETELGNMTNHFEPQLVARLYKLTRDITPGAFKGSVEYTLKFN